MASYDAGVLTNKSKRSSRIFSDLNLDFLQNTATKDIQKIEKWSIYLYQSTLYITYITMNFHIVLSKTPV